MGRGAPRSPGCFTPPIPGHLTPIPEWLPPHWEDTLLQGLYFALIRNPCGALGVCSGVCWLGGGFVPGSGLMEALARAVEGLFVASTGVPSFGFSAGWAAWQRQLGFGR